MKHTAIKAITVAIAAATMTCAIPVFAIGTDATSNTVTFISNNAEIVDQIEAKDYAACVKSSEGLNVREDPDTEARVLQKVDNGTSLHVTGSVNDANGNFTGWVRVDAYDEILQENCSGFVKAEFISEVVNNTVTEAPQVTEQTDDQDYVQADDETAEYYEQQAQDDAISEVFDKAEESGLFTQEEIDANVEQIKELSEKDCDTYEEKQSQSDQICAVLNGMQQRMIDAGLGC